MNFYGKSSSCAPEKARQHQLLPVMAESTYIAVFLVAVLACQQSTAAVTPDPDDAPYYNETVIEQEFTSIKGHVRDYLEHVVSPFNETLAAIADALRHPRRTRRSSPPAVVYLASLLKIVWQFANGVARPFLKTYLAPLQILFTFMSPRMFLRDCYDELTVPNPLPGVTSAPRSLLNPLYIRPTAQAFFVCAVDIISQVILCIKLLANMTTSIF